MILIYEQDLPESFRSYCELLTRGRYTFKHCEMCGEDFTEENTRSKEGWRETQISGYCETCFDKLVGEKE